VVRVTTLSLLRAAKLQGAASNVGIGSNAGGVHLTRQENTVLPDVQPARQAHTTQ
jgi:hypothetical protein